ncbi:MAG: hypothetical protein ACTH31_01200 [Pseudoclavibacter sp.]
MAKIARRPTSTLALLEAPVVKLRAAASVALAVALAGGLAGCNLISSQATMIQYSASDGVHVTVGDLEFRNVMILVNGDEGQTSTLGSFVGAIVNHAGESGTVTVDAEGVTGQIALDPSSSITKFGYDDGQQVLLSGAPLDVGATVEVTFTNPGGESTVFDVPVLDGTLAEYATLIPQKPAETAPATQPAPTTGDEGAVVEEGTEPIEGEEEAQP